MVRKEEMSPKDIKQTLIVAGIAFVILMAGTFVAYKHAKGRTGTIVLPGGITYLGPATTATPLPLISGKIPIPANDQWGQQKGQIYPYSFHYPKTLSLGVFPNDPFDSVTIFWGNTAPSENLLLRVEDLRQDPKMQPYVTGSKKEYVQIWWKQYAWKGVASVEEFTNSKGLKGYRAKYVDSQGQTPYDNIFFEVPGQPELVIWMTSRLLESAVFDKIIDSLTWGK